MHSQYFKPYRKGFQAGMTGKAVVFVAFIVLFWSFFVQPSDGFCGENFNTLYEFSYAVIKIGASSEIL